MKEMYEVLVKLNEKYTKHKLCLKCKKIIYKIQCYSYINSLTGNVALLRLTRPAPNGQSRIYAPRKVAALFSQRGTHWRFSRLKFIQYNNASQRRQRSASIRPPRPCYSSWNSSTFPECDSQENIEGFLDADEQSTSSPTVTAYQKCIRSSTRRSHRRRKVAAPKSKFTITFSCSDISYWPRLLTSPPRRMQHTTVPHPSYTCIYIKRKRKKKTCAGQAPSTAAPGIASRFFL